MILNISLNLQFVHKIEQCHFITGLYINHTDSSVVAWNDIYLCDKKGLN